MKNLTLSEFEHMVAILSPKKFIFTSANQRWDDVNHTIIFDFSFTDMMVVFNPNSVCFKNGKNTMCLERAKRVTVDREESPLGPIFTVICGSISSTENDVTYTIIAR